MIAQLSPLDVGITMQFMKKQAPQLAQDIVLELEAASKLAASRGLTDIQWDVLRIWPAFVQMVRDAKEELSGYNGQAVKAQRKAVLYMAELGVNDLADIAGDAKATNSDKLKAIEQLREVAGMVGKGSGSSSSVPLPLGGGSTGEGFIIINMPSSTDNLPGEAPPVGQAPAAA